MRIPKEISTETRAELTDLLAELRQARAALEDAEGSLATLTSQETETANRIEAVEAVTAPGETEKIDSIVREEVTLRIIRRRKPTAEAACNEAAETLKSAINRANAALAAALRPSLTKYSTEICAALQRYFSPSSAPGLAMQSEAFRGFLWYCQPRFDGYQDHLRAQSELAARLEEALSGELSFGFPAAQ